MIAPAHTVVLDIEQLPSADTADFWRQYLLADEISACMERRNAAGHLAARLAGKRAVLSALGSPAGICERDIAFLGAPGTAPRVAVRHSGACDVAVSLSQTAGHGGALALDTGQACGFDLLDVARWNRAMQRNGEAITARVTSSRERDLDREAGCDSAALAGARFSVKECVIKAMAGLPRGRTFHDIEVTFDRDGSPPHVGGLGVEAVSATTGPLSDDLLQSSVILAEVQ